LSNHQPVILQETSWNLLDFFFFQFIWTKIHRYLCYTLHRPPAFSPWLKPSEDWSWKQFCPCRSLRTAGRYKVNVKVFLCHEDVLGKWEWNPGYPLDRTLDGPHSRFERDGEDSESCPLPGIEPKSTRKCSLHGTPWDVSPVVMLRAPNGRRHIYMTRRYSRKEMVSNKNRINVVIEIIFTA
jgi:hypothetical protein